MRARVIHKVLKLILNELLPSVIIHRVARRSPRQPSRRPAEPLAAEKTPLDRRARFLGSQEAAALGARQPTESFDERVFNRCVIVFIEGVSGWMRMFF